MDISGNSKSLTRLRNTCEEAKKVLSFLTMTEVVIDCLYHGIDFSMTISHVKFEELNMDSSASVWSR